MRVLHAIESKEKLVAKGTYRFYHDSQATNAFEYWTMHELPNQVCIVRSDYDGRQTNNTSTLITAWYHPHQNYPLRRLERQMSGREKTERETYVFTNQAVKIDYQLDDQPIESSNYTLPHHYAVFLGGNIFWGFLIKALMEREGASVPTLTWRNGFHHDGSLTKRCTAFAEKTTLLNIAGRQTKAAKYTFTCMVDGNVWLDEYNIMLQRKNQRGFTTILTQHTYKQPIKRLFKKP